MLRDLSSLYDLPKLLDETSPPDHAGIRVLEELARTRGALKHALETLAWYADDSHYVESVEPACASERLFKDTIEETWIPDRGGRAKEALTKITGKEFK